MRRNLTKLRYPVIGRATSISAGFSTSSSGGGGRGSGRGRAGSTPFSFTVDSSPKNESNDSKFEGASPQPQGHGRGRGQPLPASPVLPTFSSLLNNDTGTHPLGRGRGFAPQKSALPPPRDESGSQSLKPRMGEEIEPEFDSESEAPARPVLPGEISNVLSGAGRGKPTKVADGPSEKPRVENRHARARHQRAEAAAASPREQLSEEDKVKRAMGILTRGDTDGGRSTSAVKGGRGARGRGIGRGRGRGRVVDRYMESDDEPAGLGDPADEEKVAKKLGPEVMNKLTEGFEEMSNRVLPSPLDDAYLDAFHTNMLLECEPEYLMEEFGRNPDIDEKPPIPLREALEKVKPFLMVYEGIQSQEEWEEVMEETMKTVPLMKEIVDHYSGPDRIAAKQQQEELERVAKTLPASAPASVKRFTDIALLSLQSNPGWGFDKKCQFMDKLVMEVSKQYN